MSSPFRDATSTQNGQVTVNKSMLLRGPQVTIISSANNPSASVISPADLLSVVSFLNRGRSMKSTSGVRMLAVLIVTALPCPSTATGEPWAAAEDVNSGAMTS